MDEKKIKQLFTQEKLKRAHPWEPVSADYLTTMEFLFLIGIDGKGKTYRETLYHLDVAASADNNHLMPDYLRQCFREGVVCVHIFGEGQRVRFHWNTEFLSKTSKKSTFNLPRC